MSLNSKQDKRENGNGRKAAHNIGIANSGAGRKYNQQK